MSGLGPSNLSVNDRLPVGVHRLADLDGHLDLNLKIFRALEKICVMFYLSALVKLDLLAGLLRVKIRNVNNLMITILVAEMKYFTKH